MKIEIGRPLGFCRIGKRGNQEDAIRPLVDELSANNTVFVVCDGMGGHANGEVASEIVADGLFSHYEEFMGDDPTPASFKVLLKYVWSKLDDQYNNNETQPQMGTTMTFVSLNRYGMLAANMGDSSIYLFRPGEITDIIFRSIDHSEVYEMIQKRFLTPLQALTYTYRNVLQKAMIPMKRYEPDVNLITDLQEGDYILLCSDGVTENLTDDMLRFIFAPYRTCEEIIGLLECHCDLSKDNHTGIVIPITNIVREEQSIILEADDTESEKYYTKSHQNNEDKLPVKNFDSDVTSETSQLYYIGNDGITTDPILDPAIDGFSQPNNPINIDMTTDILDEQSLQLYSESVEDDLVCKSTSVIPILKSKFKSDPLLIKSTESFTKFRLVVQKKDDLAE